MKKWILFTFMLLYSIFSFSQSLEERAAIETCNCLANYEKPSEKNFSECIGNSFAKTFMEEKDDKIREKANTVEGITTIMREIKALLPETCNVVKEEKIKAKREVHYADSDNQSAANYYTMAKDMMITGKYELAIEGFQLAIKEDKNYVLAYDDMAACYRKLDDYDNAIKYYKKSLAIYPEGNFSLMNIAVVYSLKSDFKNSVRYYEKLIDYEPNNAEGYYGAGKAYFGLKEYEKALDNIFKAHRIYTNENSDYKADSEKIMAMMYQKLKAEDKEALFIKIAESNNIKLN